MDSAAEEIIPILLQCPPELDLLTEAVHSVSQTIDSRHFAEEFLRRRKLADKGIVDTSSVASPADKNSGGWSEVAKKGGQSSTAASAPGLEQGVGFKVVAAKKKGRK